MPVVSSTLKSPRSFLRTPLRMKVNIRRVSYPVSELTDLCFLEKDMEELGGVPLSSLLPLGRSRARRFKSARVEIAYVVEGNFQNRIPSSLKNGICMSMEMRFIYNSDNVLLQNNKTAEISFVHLMFPGDVIRY